MNGSRDFLFSRQKRENKNESLVNKEKDITRIWWEKTSRWYHSESFAISSGYKKQSSINVYIFIYLIYWLSVLSLLTLCIYSAIHFLDDISKYINNGICNNKKTKENNSMVFANKRLLYLKFDGINFIVNFIVRFVPHMYCVSELCGYSGVRRYQEIPCFPKDNGYSETKKSG